MTTWGRQPGADNTLRSTARTDTQIYSNVLMPLFGVLRLEHTRHSNVVRSFEDCHLERALQYPNGEVGSGVGRQPEAEVGVWLRHLLQFLLQFSQPFHQQVAVLQHQPLSARDRRLQQRHGQLWTDDTQLVRDRAGLMWHLVRLTFCCPGGS